MVKIMTIRQSTVCWVDEEGDTYTYPRCMFPADLEVNQKYDYRAGEFHRIEE